MVAVKFIVLNLGDSKFIMNRALHIKLVRNLMEFYYTVHILVCIISLCAISVPSLAQIEKFGPDASTPLISPSGNVVVVRNANPEDVSIVNSKDVKRPIWRLSSNRVVKKVYSFDWLKENLIISFEDNKSKKTLLFNIANKSEKLLLDDVFEFVRVAPDSHTLLSVSAIGDKKFIASFYDISSKVILINSTKLDLENLNVLGWDSNSLGVYIDGNGYEKSQNNNLIYLSKNGSIFPLSHNESSVDVMSTAPFYIRSQETGVTNNFLLLYSNGYNSVMSFNSEKMISETPGRSLYSRSILNKKIGAFQEVCLTTNGRFILIQENKLGSDGKYPIWVISLFKRKKIKLLTHKPEIISTLSYNSQGLVILTAPKSDEEFTEYGFILFPHCFTTDMSVLEKLISDKSWQDLE